QDEPEVLLTQGDHVVETLTTDGPNETLGKGVEAGAARGQSDRLHARDAEKLGKSGSEEWIPIVNKVAVLSKESIEGIGPVARALLEYVGAGLRGNVRDFDAPCFEVEDEEPEIPNEPVCGEDLDREEIGGGD